MSTTGENKPSYTSCPCYTYMDGDTDPACPLHGNKITRENKKVDLESEWRVLDRNMIYQGDKFIALITNHRCAQPICDAINASLRQLREQKEEVEQRLAALRKDHEDATDNYEYDRETLNASLLQHESVIEKMREILTRLVAWKEFPEKPETKL